MNTESIQDHAIIGNGRSAALVSKRGAIDWLCWPRFDSPSIFGALIDERAGHWQLAPLNPTHIHREYVGATNVLRTRFDTAGGSVSVIDLMPVASEAQQRSQMTPEHQILRIAECQQGEVELVMTFAPRPDYGRKKPVLHDAGPLGIRIECDHGVLFLRSDAACSIRDEGDGETIVCRQQLVSGQRAHFSLTFASDWMAILPPLGDFSRTTLEQSLHWWEQWSARCVYRGPGREAVLRSALLLKLLVYAPSGAVVAAPTTSLPEQLGGNLNWDYRYCWLRDASLTVRAFLGLGFHEEARAFVDWLIQSTRLTRPQLRTLYDVHGNRPVPEQVLGHLTGYENSRPVRIGNAAEEQLQLDIYGEVIDATTRLVRAGESLDRETQGFLGELGEQVCQSWRLPDAGMWETRARRAQHTHSALLCWVALDRLLELEGVGHLRRKLPSARFRKTRDEIRAEIETRAWNQGLQSYVAELDGSEVDANLLLFPWYGFEKASSARMHSTYGAILRRLAANETLLYRYSTDGDRQSDEGAFGVCCFWQVEFLAQGGGSLAHAARLFEQLCAKANDVGLFAEEIDPASDQARGNFPQAFTHVGLVNSALTLADQLDQEVGSGPEIHERKVQQQLESRP